jgi:hypothetical protein
MSTNLSIAKEMLAVLSDGAAIGQTYPLGRQLTEGVLMRLEDGDLIVETSHPTKDERWQARVHQCYWGKFSQSELDELSRIVQVSLKAWIRYWESSNAVDPNDPDYRRKKRGLELWNSGKTWKQVAVDLDNDPFQTDAIKLEIKRFAAKYNLPIRTGKPGSPKLNE